ncbi:hypothetical protein [Erythrobacter aureus]|uniref:hypothetical protein n=1 Tax=Erythrobacter aureus TaxID=2182384 RepID=UPI001F1871D3|nr:hypothetical protein [Erythrobacter aureus]
MNLQTATYHWRSRDGAEATVSLDNPTSREQADEFARSVGWPGHAGTRWDYLKDDLRALRTALAKLASLRIRDIF